MARLIAFYLPQFHPIPENDRWWGKGFTEWTNAAKAKPMFRGHYQPHIPADLGFYDLRVSETRIAQAAMAAEYGIEAFCYYHYWFGGKRLLERPFSEVLASGKPDFPFCLCWANQTWTGVWHGAPDRVLVKQTYPGHEDHAKHFEALLPAFSDRRYATVDGKPLFLVYQPADIPNVREFTRLWREMAEKAGLTGLYLVGFSWSLSWNPEEHGFDAAVVERLPPRREYISRQQSLAKWLLWQYQLRAGKPTVYPYEKVISRLLVNGNGGWRRYPCVIPNWDNTPRSGRAGLVFHESTPELFRVHLKQALTKVCHLPEENRIVFVKSWNEWAEGNHLEPDLRFGKAYLQVIAEETRRGTA